MNGRSDADSDALADAMMGSPIEARSPVARDAADAPPPPRPFHWSVRRELWENRSITLGPIAVAGVLLFGFLISTITLPERMRGLAALSPAEQHQRIVAPFSAAAGLPVVTAFLIAVFYCLDALYGERRDRSILFWKSLPVSDRTTVLSKVTVPLVVLPAIVYPVVILTQLVMLVVSAAVLAANGIGFAPFWERLSLFQMWVAIAYALVAIALSHAPVYAWLLLVSAWARRAPFLWAVLPPLAIAAFERVAFGTFHFGSAIGRRLMGWFTLGFDPFAPGTDPGEPLSHLTPGRFLGAPGLWIGLAFAAACLAGAVRLRRHREPI